MNNEERRLVGTRYKEAGQAEAMKLGHELVSGDLREERINHWEAFIKKNPQAKLYCFRGGLRSQISTSWIRERGITIEYIPGGYKALRRFLLETIDEEVKNRKFLIIAGKTGNGKTPFLTQSKKPFLDLEKAANHKGSSFGILGSQPNQITFENRIADSFLKSPNDAFTLLEDESVMIGSAIVPRAIVNQIHASPIMVLEKTIEERVKHITHDYVFAKNEFFCGDIKKTQEFMLSALGRIEKKLGGLRTQSIRILINQAFLENDPLNPASHAEWIHALLTHYYDPLYERSLKKNERRVVFRGDEKSCLSFIAAYRP
jgi:tRNA 2-selenouridine synthase